MDVEETKNNVCKEGIQNAAFVHGSEDINSVSKDSLFSTIDFSSNDLSEGTLDEAGLVFPVKRNHM